ncbi:extracellular solute-binding protein [Amphibacillus sp. MSJ-3]|uniref:ABC transporter substrate-binding protein n=1 Tax=Amphibacillus sp. MSJ-3 TaxID=2841505 RepID=UPI001C0EC593|nr:extracellular solute-binding protein [Amphibacillus sp. MSJ-3]MBU5595530.1 extracellular solute-binding protein [Amphibacillus sp. MSJ-3]
MTRKAMIRLVAIISLVFMFVVGCDSKDNDTTTDTEPGTDNVDNTGDEGEEPEGLPPMTDEEITLTFSTWLDANVYESMAEAFMEKYPNITVEVIYGDIGEYNDFLTNLASNGDLPDVFWYLGNVDVPIRNMWLGDFTEYFESDPETNNLLDTLAAYGYFDGERKMAAASAYFPFTIFLDENLFEQQNVDMPSPDWTYNEMLDLIEKMTIPEQGIYGMSSGTNLVTMAPIVNEDAYGEFGWDGEKFDMTGQWAESTNKRAEFIRNGNHAPFGGTDEAEAAFGDRDIWAAETGRVAIQFDYYPTIGTFKQDVFTDKGIKWVPYPVPKGDHAETLNKPAFVDFGTISPATEHPREAYELLKWMGWGRDGWETKIDIYKQMQNEDPNYHPEGLPLVKDEDLWASYRELLPEGDYYQDYLDRVKYPVPLGGAVLPGFESFLNEVYFGGEYGNVEQAVIDGEINALNIAPDLTDMLNQYYSDAMDELFY